jgi:hypothetical protein
MSNYSSSPNFHWGHPTPGPQSPTGQEIMNHVFFASNSEWKKIREEMHFDFIVIGTGFCSLAFVERTLKNNPKARILILERGEFFLPEHFQNLPVTFKSTLGGLSETFPWTLSHKTYQGNDIRFQFGMVPFFGGRSTVWSGWCPRPTRDELIGWPDELIDTLFKYYSEAENLLNVIPADQIKSNTKNKPVYGILQKGIQKRLEESLNKVPSLTRVMAAPLAVKNPFDDEIDFAKFSVPNPLLQLVESQKLLELHEDGAALKIATNCVVTKIIQENGCATALDTSRGIVNIGEAKLIMAMGTMPAATLLRNSFPEIKKIGDRYTTHFISSIIARIPRNHFDFDQELGLLELGAFYIGGTEPKLGHKGQFHIQMTALSDRDPKKNVFKALRNMPDVVATASMDQLLSSEEHIVFVCAVLGELDWNNPENWFKGNSEGDLSVNSTLQIVTNDNDKATWNAMDSATFDTLEKIISPKGNEGVEYWQNSQNKWEKNRPLKTDYRPKGTVHDASTLWIGKDKSAVVGLDFRPYDVENVYITGGALWPTGASWNPTLTMVALAQILSDNLTRSE